MEKPLEPSCKKMKLLFSNARILDVHSPFHGLQIDILIEGGFIVDIGSGLTAENTIDLKNKSVSPGLFDLFAHFNEPGFEHKEDLESGKNAARFGGATDVCLIPNNNPVTESKSDVMFLKSKSGDGVEIHALGAASKGCKGKELTEMIDLNAAGAIAFTDGTNSIWNTELLVKALQYVQKFEGLIINRAKDIYLSRFSQMHESERSAYLGLKGEPSISEAIAVKRDLEILKYAGGKIHFTQISTAKAVRLIKDAKKKGLHVTCDVALHQLAYTHEDIGDYDTNYKVDPPLRTEQDRKSLIKGIKDGTIDAIVSSHQPQGPENKKLEFDLSDTGIGTLPTIIAEALKLQAQVPLETVIEKMTAGPRRVLGQRAVSIDKGSPACLSIFDLGTKWTYDDSTNPSKSRNSPLFGKELTGKCFGIYNHGKFFQN